MYELCLRRPWDEARLELARFLTEQAPVKYDWFLCFLLWTASASTYFLPSPPLPSPPSPRVQLWLKNAEEVTWEKLAEGLESVGQGELAKKVREKHSKEEEKEEEKEVKEEESPSDKVVSG